MRVIFSAVISLSTAERNCARQALKGLRNGISCSTGSALALAIVRSYYRLLAAKGDNTASRSGKTQPSINGISRRKSLLAARVDVPGVARDLCPARASQNRPGTEAGRDVLIAVPPWVLSASKVDAVQLFWTACSKNSCPGEERNLLLQLLVDLLFVGPSVFL